MEFFSLTYPWYDHTRKRQFLFISLYPLSFDEGRTSGAGVRPLSLPAQPALRHIQNGRRGQAPAQRVCRAQTCCAPTHPPEYFSGMAPAAARRARSVQRSRCQGLPGDRRGPPGARQRLKRTEKGTGRGCTPGSCFVCTAFRRHEPPYWGVQGGRSPPGPSFSPFLREEMGAPAAQARPTDPGG